MERLHAPWRMTYILGAEETPERCIFCQYPSEGPSRFAERLILCATERAFVMMNKYPYSGGHLLVVPRAHVADLSALDETDHRALADLLRASSAAARAALSPHGMNLGMNLGRSAGAGIDQHCHWHIVPRWNGDTNFMLVLGDVRVVSESLESAYRRLLPHFATLGTPPEPTGAAVASGAP